MTQPHWNDSGAGPAFEINLIRDRLSGLKRTRAIDRFCLLAAFALLALSALLCIRTIGHAGAVIRNAAGVSRLRAATLYPKIVLCVFAGLTAAIFLLFIPRFSEIFAEYNAKLPPLSKFFIDISMFLRSHVLVLSGATAGLIALAVGFARTPRGKDWLDRASLKTPMFGPLLLKSAIARLSLTLATLLGNGIALTDSLQVAGATLGSSTLEAGLRDARRNVMMGFSLAESLARVPQLPQLLARMVRVGEESGSLSDMLEDVATYYDQEVDYGLNRVAAMIQPLLICALGGVVLITLIAVYLPIFSLGRAIGGG